MKKILLILFLIVLLSNCHQKSLKKIDLNNDDLKLFLISTNLDPDTNYIEMDNTLENDSFYKKNQIICIENKDELKKIQDLYLTRIKESQGLSFSYCHYLVSLFDKNVGIWGGFLDIKKNILTDTDEYYSIDFENLIKDSSNFKKISNYKLKIKEIQTARTLYNLLIKNNIIIYGLQNNDENPLFLYNGVISLKTDTSKFNINRTHEKNSKELESDLEKYGNTKILNWEFNISKSKDINIKVLTDNDFTSKLTNKYEIVVPYKNWENINLVVFDIDEQKLIQIIEKNGLIGINYEKI